MAKVTKQRSAEEIKELEKLEKLKAELVGNAKCSTVEIDPFFIGADNITPITVDKHMKLTAKPKKLRLFRKKLTKATLPDFGIEESDKESDKESDEESYEESDEEEKNLQITNPEVMDPEQINAMIQSGLFWNTIIRPLAWCDSDESERTKMMIINAIPNSNTRRNLKSIISKLSEVLHVRLSEEKEFLELSQSDQINLAAHIVGKGKQFYDSVIESPALAMYLIDGPPKKHKYQRLWDFLV